MKLGLFILISTVFLLKFYAEFKTTLNAIPFKYSQAGSVNSIIMQVSPSEVNRTSGYNAASGMSSLLEIIKKQIDTKESDKMKVPDDYTNLWNRLDSMIGNRSLYPEDFDVTIAKSALRHAKLEMVDLFVERTSFKWIIHLEGGQKVLFKPALVNATEKLDGCNMGCEHPEYEIAGFTINRLLGYRNFPFTTGRILNWTKEVFPVATARLKAVFTSTKDGDLCIRYHCLRVRDHSERCFKKGAIPGAIIYFLRRKLVPRAEPGRPFHQYYPRVEYMEKPREYMLKLPGDESYCKVFRKIDLYKRPRDFGDILDITVFSYITNHRDQKLNQIWSESSYMHVIIDNGLSFCPHYSMIVGAPIYQCCKIRRKTFERLDYLKDTLPSIFDEMTRDDPLYPLLQPDQLLSIKKRIKMLLALTEYCIHLKGFENVVEDFL